MSASVWIINIVVLAVLLEADLGRRRIGWFRVLRPLIASAAVVPTYLKTIPTGHANGELIGLGVLIGIVLGVACHLYVRVGFDPEMLRRGKVSSRLTPGSRGTQRGVSVSRAGFAYATYWVVIFAARLAFSYGSQHWFAASLGRFLAQHHLSGNALTDSLILMALTLALVRSLVLGMRGAFARRHSRITGAPVAV